MGSQNMLICAKLWPLLSLRGTVHRNIRPEGHMQAFPISLDMLAILPVKVQLSRDPPRGSKRKGHAQNGSLHTNALGPFGTQQ